MIGATFPAMNTPLVLAAFITSLVIGAFAEPLREWPAHRSTTTFEQAVADLRASHEDRVKAGLSFNVVDYGAVGNGDTVCTAAIAKAVQAAAAAARQQGVQAELLFPAGTFLTGPFNLSSSIVMYMDDDAKVKAVDDFDAWQLVPPYPSYGRGRNHPGPRYESFISAWNATNVAIVGTSNNDIDGSGMKWWAAAEAHLLNHTRGHLIETMYSSEVQLVNLFLSNSPFWTVHPYGSDSVRARFVRIHNPVGSSPNTDGFDPDSSTNVVIEDSHFAVGDDAVAIKSGWDCFGIQAGMPTLNITIYNLTALSPTCAGICIGSEMSGGVGNVWVDGLDATLTQAPIRIKSNDRRGGFVTNLHFHNVRGGVPPVGGYAVWLDDHYGSRNPDCPPDAPPAYPDIADILIANMSTAGGQEAVRIRGLPQSPIRNVTILDASFDGAAAGFECENVTGHYRNVSPQPCPQLLPLDT